MQFSIRRSRICIPTARSRGSSSGKRFRRTPPIVLPHSAKRASEKQHIAHRKKLSPIASVFPERTAPSQMTAS